MHKKLAFFQVLMVTQSWLNVARRNIFFYYALFLRKTGLDFRPYLYTDTLRQDILLLTTL